MIQLEFYIKTGDGIRASYKSELQSTKKGIDAMLLYATAKQLDMDTLAFYQFQDQDELSKVENGEASSSSVEKKKIES